MSQKSYQNLLGGYIPLLTFVTKIIVGLLTPQLIEDREDESMQESEENDQSGKSKLIQRF